MSLGKGNGIDSYGWMKREAGMEDHMRRKKEGDGREGINIQTSQIKSHLRRDTKHT